MKKILIIHQSAEMYGSDKTILLFLTHIDKSKFQPVVILPSKGPLYNEIAKLNIPIYTNSVVKLYRDIFKPLNFVKFILEIFTTLNFIRKLDKKYKFDFIYSNTIAVLLGFNYSFLFNKKHIWHVHEIIEKPTIIRKTFQFLLNNKANSHIVFNSLQTQKFWSENKKHISNKGICIWNGLDINNVIFSDSTEINLIRQSLFNIQNPNEIALGLVGRISSWKGHQLLLDAFSKIESQNPDLKLVFIGSCPPNQDHFLMEINKKIQILNLTSKVSIIPFQDNIWDIWAALDIAVIPSTEPEPFGMVAIEAMLANKPVIAAKHGGLQEIVVDQVTGLFFSPNNSEDLSKKILNLTQNSDLRILYGINGNNVVKEKFSIEAHMNQFYKILNN